jgi:hypothetical protein
MLSAEVLCIWREGRAKMMVNEMEWGRGERKILSWEALSSASSQELGPEIR